MNLLIKKLRLVVKKLAQDRTDRKRLNKNLSPDRVNPRSTLYTTARHSSKKKHCNGKKQWQFEQEDKINGFVNCSNAQNQSLDRFCTFIHILKTMLQTTRRRNSFKKY